MVSPLADIRLDYIYRRNEYFTNVEEAMNELLNDVLHEFLTYMVKLKAKIGVNKSQKEVYCAKRSLTELTI